MWKCKKCGCTHFNLFFSRKIEAEFDSVEVVETYSATLEILKENYVECIECKNKGKNIEDIATWEEEDERD